MTDVTEGAPAPDFELAGADGPMRLSDFKDRTLVLYFYPKDDTPGCTKQACSFRDQWGKLQEKGIVVLGVSPDGVERHQKFATKYQLPFPLLADPDHAIAEAYGVWGEKTLYGKKFMGLMRTTFLIDETGTVRHVWKKPKTEIHAEEVLSKL